MLILLPCGHEAELNELDWQFCMEHGEPVTGFRWQGKSWHPALPDAIVLHWLAQSERRENFPLDSSEGVGLAAFEYAWKAFNQLYDGFGNPDATGMARVRLCLRAYLDASAFVRDHKESLSELCHYVLNDDQKLKDEFKKIVIAFPGEPEQRIQRILKKAASCCKQIRSAMKSGNPYPAVEEMSRVLYALRNARIHGHYEAASIRVPRQGHPVPGSPPTDKFKTILFLLRELDVSLLAGKLKVPETDIRELVTSRTLQLVQEIRNCMNRVEVIDRVTFTIE